MGRTKHGKTIHDRLAHYHRARFRGKVKAPFSCPFCGAVAIVIRENKIICGSCRMVDEAPRMAAALSADVDVYNRWLDIVRKKNFQQSSLIKKEG